VTIHFSESILKSSIQFVIPEHSQCKKSFSDLPPNVCQSVTEILVRIGDKWSILTIAVLARGRMRFSELKRSLGSISQKVLTSTLRGLERDGYVSRLVTPTIPPRVDYELTEMGRDVLDPVTALATWAVANRSRVEGSRAEFDQSQAPKNPVGQQAQHKTM
jgi:DNA-binding HxlR family transcriptional regulator